MKQITQTMSNHLLTYEQEQTVTKVINTLKLEWFLGVLYGDFKKARLKGYKILYSDSQAAFFYKLECEELVKHLSTLQILYRLDTLTNEEGPSG